MQDKNNTQYFKVEKEQQIKVDQVLEVVYGALREKGYNPVKKQEESTIRRRIEITMSLEMGEAYRKWVCGLAAEA